MTMSRLASRRAALGSIAAATAVLPMATLASEPDPIFALIEEHKAADRDASVAWAAVKDPGRKNAWRKYNDAEDAAEAALFLLLTTMPKTLKVSRAWSLFEWAEKEASDRGRRRGHEQHAPLGLY